MKITFRGGVHPPDLKKLTNHKAIAKAPLPKQVVIPLSQHTGAVCEPAVSLGETIKTGTLIGKSDKFISAHVHSSISGKVAKIEPRPHPVLGTCNCIVIESDGNDDAAFTNKYAADTDKLTKEEIINIIKEAGIAGLGGACFPTHVKLSPPKNKTIDAFILNGAECEPYLSCDYRIMLEEPQAIIKGILLMMKALGVNKGIIAIEDNKPDAIKIMQKEVTRSWFDRLTTPRQTIPSEVEGQGDKVTNLKVVTLKTKYPQGAEKQIIKAALNRTVPAGGLPLDVGCVVQNAQTAYAVYEAVYFNKPLIERVITITGSCVKNPINTWAKIGTLLSDLIDLFGGFTIPPKQVIFGGPMMGIGQYTMDVPIIKGTSGIIFLSEKEIDKSQEAVCIRCGKCLEACPINLAPTTLMQRVKKDKFSEAEELGIANCYECGACAFECPAKIPLLDYMKFGKANLSAGRDFKNG